MNISFCSSFLLVLCWLYCCSGPLHRHHPFFTLSRWLFYDIFWMIKTIFSYFYLHLSLQYFILRCIISICFFDIKAFPPLKLYLFDKYTFKPFLILYNFIFPILLFLLYVFSLKNFLFLFFFLYLAYWFWTKVSCLISKEKIIFNITLINFKFINFNYHLFKTIYLYFQF